MRVRRGSRSPSTLFFLVALGAVLVAPRASSAQEAPPAVDTSAPEAATASGPATTAAAEPAATPVARVAPLIIAPIPDRTITPAVMSAVRDAVVQALIGLAGGRPVTMLDSARLPAIARCAPGTCVGAIVAEAGGVAAALVRMTRRPASGPVTVTVELVDPVGGTSRGSATASVAIGADNSATIGAWTGDLAAAMPTPPPPPPTLLIAVNIDGARVSLDGREIGVSPVAVQDVQAGGHTVGASHPAYHAGSQRVTVPETGRSRVDLELEPTAGMSEQSYSLDEFGAAVAEAPPDEEPFFTRWYVIAGAAAVVVAAIVIVAVVVGSEPAPQGPPIGIPLPGLQ